METVIVEDRQPNGDAGIEIIGLHSAKSTLRLEQIARLRARGIGNHIDLPQLVVCGDQSSGKSSVLEGLTGLPFPRQDGVCTKFPTEIILQHTVGGGDIVATILPALFAPENLKDSLHKYRRYLNDFTELPIAIAEAGQLMKIRGFGDVKDGPAFADHVLRIEVSGPVGLHLTVVDLPGLISVPNDEQTDADIQIVHRLVDDYIANPRTIILAIVQAGNDIANQTIIRKSRQIDKAGHRTVGIITKPDLINEGSEKRIALLAKNQDTTRLKLGYFLVKNPTPTEISDGISAQQRQKNEVQFFQASPWKETSLSMDRVGVVALRGYLQTLLDQHIEQELPKVRAEIHKLLVSTEKQISSLGDSRPSISHIRIFLSRLATRFSQLATSALNGTYHEADTGFFQERSEEDQPRRLRATIHRMNTSFADVMRENGQKRKLTSRAACPSDTESESGAESVVGEEYENAQLLTTSCEMKQWVKEVYIASRGKELPGNYNHVLLSELFTIQSSRWQKLAEDHVAKLCSVIRLFVKASLSHVTGEEQVRVALQDITDPRVQQSKTMACEELEKLHLDEKQQPITYNHYYTDNIQKARQDTTRKMIRKAMEDSKTHDWNGKLHISNNNLDAEKLLASLQSHIVVNMEDQACTEALAGLEAYYKVALKTYVDNVCRQVIERHLVRGLPDVLCPEIIASLGDEDLARIASESPSNIRRRDELCLLQKNLREGLHDLRR